MGGKIPNLTLDKLFLNVSHTLLSWHCGGKCGLGKEVKEPMVPALDRRLLRPDDAPKQARFHKGTCGSPQISGHETASQMQYFSEIAFMEPCSGKAAAVIAAKKPSCFFKKSFKEISRPVQVQYH